MCMNTKLEIEENPKRLGSLRDELLKTIEKMKREGKWIDDDPVKTVVFRG